MQLSMHRCSSATDTGQRNVRHHRSSLLTKCAASGNPRSRPIKTVASSTGPGHRFLADRECLTLDTSSLGRKHGAAYTNTICARYHRSRESASDRIEWHAGTVSQRG